MMTKFISAVEMYNVTKRVADWKEPAPGLYRRTHFQI